MPCCFSVQLVCHGESGHPSHLMLAIVRLSVVRRLGTLRLLPSSSSSLLSARSPASRRRFRALVATSMHSVLSLAANAGTVWYPKYTCVGWLRLSRFGLIAEVCTAPFCELLRRQQL